MNNQLQSLYLSSADARRRNSIGLNAWAGYVAALPVPADPTDEWIRQRVVAEQIPMMLDATVVQTIGYFHQDTKTQEDIYDLISPIRDDAREQQLSSRIEMVIGGFINRYAAQVVTAAQVTDWKIRNGIEIPA